MSTAIELVWRELVLLALLGALGSGAVVLLHAANDRASRWALAPAYGLAIDACVFDTTITRVPGHRTGWLLAVLAVASVAFALWRTRGARSPRALLAGVRLPLRETAQLAVIVVVVLGAFDAPYAARNTSGPIGGYRVADTPGYINETDGALAESLHGTAAHQPPFSDLTLQNWHGQAANFQELGPDTSTASVSALLGWPVTDALPPFVIVWLVAGALCAYAAVRRITRTRSWWAIAPAILFAGPFFHTLLNDGSLGAISGLVLVIPALTAGWDALTDGRWTDCALLALMLAGLQSMYPLFVPHLVIVGAIVLIVMAVMLARRNRLTAALARAVTLRLGFIIVLSAALTPVAFQRNLRYWESILSGDFSFAGLPVYDLPVGVLPGWLAQTREFYDLPHLATLGAGGVISSIVVPVVLLAVIVIGLRRHPVALAGVVIVVASALLAYKTATGDHCSYCVQRNLLVAGPVIFLLIGLGLVVLAASGRTGRIAAAVIAVAAIVIVGGKTLITVDRFTDGAYVLDRQVRDVTSHLPTDAPVVLEGFAQGPLAPMEEPVVYQRVDELTPRDVSIYTGTDESRGLLMIGGAQPIGPQFNPDYRYVLTRLAGIRTERRTLRRSGPIALEARARPLDVLLTAGPRVGFVWQDMTGAPWVQPNVPVAFYVVGDAPGNASIDLTLRASVPVTVSGADRVKQTGSRLDVCLPTSDRPPVRLASVSFSFTPTPPPTPSKYEISQPPRGLRLVAMRASTSPCPGRATSR